MVHGGKRSSTSANALHRLSSWTEEAGRERPAFAPDSPVTGSLDLPRGNHGERQVPEVRTPHSSQAVLELSVDRMHRMLRQHAVSDLQEDGRDEADEVRSVAYLALPCVRGEAPTPRN